MTFVKNYLSLVKFSHTIFAMPFALIGFFVATQYYNYPFEWQKLIAVIACMVLARNAAMAFNRYADSNFDALNPRTAIREIPAGAIPPQAALFFVIANALLFIAVCYFFINTLCFYLSPVALAVVLGYSYTKRFTALCHMVLGVGLALAPVGAFVAVSNRFETLPILLGACVLTWVSGFDIIYALQDETFDKQHKLNSIPAFWGKKNALKIANILHIICSLIVFYIGITYLNGVYYWIGAGLFVGLLFYQHTLVKPNDLSKINLAFFTTNGIASVVFASFVILYLFLKN